MGLLSLAIWTPIAFGLVLLALGRDEHPNPVRWLALVWDCAGSDSSPGFTASHQQSRGAGWWVFMRR